MVDSRVNDFNSSIRFDQRMIAQDMRGSGVHAAMLARQGIISEQDCADILSGLASIADDLSSGALTIDPAAEDVHTFVEQTLTARIGDAGKRLHTGRNLYERCFQHLLHPGSRVPGQPAELQDG